MRFSDMYQNHCSGCGLCKSVLGAEIIKTKEGFYRPVLTGNTNFDRLSSICPSINMYSAISDKDEFWGKTLSLEFGYTSNEDIRHKASSGGVITQLCCYLLGQKLVDGILHIGVEKNQLVNTHLYCSTSKEQVLEHCGSRYAPSAPLINIDKYIGDGKKYALVGKPCDIRAMRNYARINSQVDVSVPYMFSFFCAGTPSAIASKTLINRMGCDNENAISLEYRGNGWPGMATVVDNCGKKYTMDYESSWAGILGRTVQKVCRFCWDGIGEEADISCGDAWYLVNGKPSFDENKGRNIIITRSNKGKELLERCIENKVIILDHTQKEQDVKFMQPYQYDRRATMYDKLLAMKFCFRSMPKADMRRLKKYTVNVSKKRNIQIFLGIVKRVMKRKI